MSVCMHGWMNGWNHRWIACMDEWIHACACMNVCMHGWMEPLCHSGSIRSGIRRSKQSAQAQGLKRRVHIQQWGIVQKVMTYTDSGTDLRTNWSLRTGRKPVTGTNDPSESANTPAKCGKCLKFNRIQLQNQNTKHRKLYVYSEYNSLHFSVMDTSKPTPVQCVNRYPSVPSYLSWVPWLLNTLTARMHICFPANFIHSGSSTDICHNSYNLLNFSLLNVNIQASKHNKLACRCEEY